MNNFQLRFFSSIFLLLPIILLFSNNNFLFLTTIIFLLSTTLWEFLRLLSYRNDMNVSDDKSFYLLLSRQKISVFDFFFVILINFLVLIFFLNSKNYFSFLPLIIVVLTLFFIFKDF